jgi:hypothetical protein
VRGSSLFVDIGGTVDHEPVKNKRDYINFPIVNFPFTKCICNNISAAPAYGV